MDDPFKKLPRDEMEAYLTGSGGAGHEKPGEDRAGTAGTARGDAT